MNNLRNMVLFFVCQDGMFKLKDDYHCSVLVAKALDYESKTSYVLNITASNVSRALLFKMIDHNSIVIYSPKALLWT